LPRTWEPTLTKNREMWERVREGEILTDVLIVDAHTHMGPWYNFHVPDDHWADGLIAAMNTCGIDFAVTTPHVGIGPDPVEGNRIAAEAVETHPDRFAAYCAVNPNYPEAEMRDQMEGSIADGPCCAIKIHPTTHDYAAHGPAYEPMWSFAHENRLPVLVHTWGGDPLCGPLLFDDIARRYPGARIILGHSGASVSGIRESIQAAASRPNLYLDLTKSFMHQGLLEEMVAAVGPERVLFGTDVPFIDCRSQIGYVASARISEEEKRLIFGRNALELFRLSLPDPPVYVPGP
jgi:uncharacterized protein